MCHHRHHDVKLKIPVRGCPGDCHIVADHLRANHHQGFAHDRVHLARHDRAARLRRRKLNLTNAAARTTPQPANVISDLKKTHRDRFQIPARFDNCVLAALRFEMIFRLVKRDAGPLLQMPQHFFRKIDVPVQAGANCRPAKRQFAQNFDRSLRAVLCVGNLLRVTGKFLTEPDRRGVHQMCPANLDDVPEFFSLRFKCSL